MLQSNGLGGAGRSWIQTLRTRPRFFPTESKIQRELCTPLNFLHPLNPVGMLLLRIRFQAARNKNNVAFALKASPNPPPRHHPVFTSESHAAFPPALNFSGSCPLKFNAAARWAAEGRRDSPEHRVNHSSPTATEWVCSCR